MWMLKTWIHGKEGFDPHIMHMDRVKERHIDLYGELLDAGIAYRKWGTRLFKFVNTKRSHYCIRTVEL